MSRIVQEYERTPPRMNADFSPVRDRKVCTGLAIAEQVAYSAREVKS